MSRIFRTLLGILIFAGGCTLPTGPQHEYKVDPMWVLDTCQGPKGLIDAQGCFRTVE